jgi:hypothetical protein
LRANSRNNDRNLPLTMSESKSRVAPQILSEKAIEQLKQWRIADTALGMIYARANHEASVWARVTIESIHDRLLICAGDEMHFMLMIANARFSVEALEHWSKPAITSAYSTVEGLQIWCTNGDWVFLTEQIAESRTLSLVHHS